MTATRRGVLADQLRRQLLTELRAGTRRVGDRLPSARVVARQVGADPRVVLAAYRDLAREGIVELRERSGIFVSARPHDDVAPAAPAAAWLAELLTQAVSRALPAPELADWVARATGAESATAPPRAAVVAATADQAEGIRRELSEFYGVAATALPPGVQAARAWAAAAAEGGALPPGLRRADLIVTTDACATPVRRIAERLAKPFVSVDVRGDLVGPEWRLLLRQPVYVVVTDARFVTTIRHYFADTPGVENLHAAVLGRDSLDAIPADATVYVTQAARARLGDAQLPGRVVPPARLFSVESAREIMTIVVGENLRRWRKRVGGRR